MTGEQQRSRDLAAAYEGVEVLAAFPDQASIERYRAALLSRTTSQAAFLAERLRPDARVLEIGSGNGRLLLALASRGAIDGGVGIDLATSRIDFAQAWARDIGIDSVRFEVADVLEAELPSGPFAAACCITGAFAYFEAVAAGAAAELASRLIRVLEPGGLLCLEIYPHPEHRRLLDGNDGRIRIWSELPEDDPWRFYLSDLSRDESGSILTHEKTFIHRTDGRIDSGRSERLFLYTEESLSELLVAAGFEEVRAYEEWSSDPYSGGEIMVVTAVTPSPT